MATAGSLRVAKQLLRKELKVRLKLMTAEEKKVESRLVTKKLLGMPRYEESESISLYLSMPSEVCTLEILKHAMKSGKKCYIPYYHGEEMDMVLLRDMEDYHQLPVTQWNIKQPDRLGDRERALVGTGLDLIIVPGLGFTKDGLRLGRGKGYYDNYFRKCERVLKRQVFTVGLAYSCQVLEELPVDERDVKLDVLLYS